MLACNISVNFSLGFERASMRNEPKVYRDRVEQQVVGQLFFQDVIDVDRSKTRFSGVRKLVDEMATGCWLCFYAMQLQHKPLVLGLRHHVQGPVHTGSLSTSFAAVQAISEQLERLNDDNGDCWYTVSERTLYNVSRIFALSPFHCLYMSCWTPSRRNTWPVLVHLATGCKMLSFLSAIPVWWLL